MSRGVLRLTNPFFFEIDRTGFGYYFGDLTAATLNGTAVAYSGGGAETLNFLFNLSSFDTNPFYTQVTNLLAEGGFVSSSVNPFPVSAFNVGGESIADGADPLPFGRGRPQGGSVADFNLDGDFDVIISSDTDQAVGQDVFFTVDTPGTLTYFDNNGLSRFAEAIGGEIGIIDPARYLSMVTGDLDNDGDDDFIVFTLSQGTRVFYNTLIEAGPNPTSDADFFSFHDATNEYLHPVFETDVSPGSLFQNSRRINATTSVDFSDINRDGFIDFVVGRGGFNTIQGDRNDLYLNTNTKPFNLAKRVFKLLYATHPGPGVVLPQTFTLLDPTTDIALAELNGDIYDDLIVLNRGTPSEVYLNTDADDKNDVSFISATIYPYDPNGGEPDGYFVRQTPLPFPDSATRQSVTMAIGNFNHLDDGGTIGGAPYDGTGRLDIVVGNGPNVRNLLFRNNGDGTFTDASAGLPRVTNPFTGDDLDDTRDIVTSDFNGDGNLDLFVLNRYQVRTIEGTPTITKERSRLLFGDGRGNFTDVTAGPDTVLGTSDDRLPLIVGEVTSALVGDFDLAGSPTEDLDGDGRLRSHEPEFIERIPKSTAAATDLADLATTVVEFDYPNVGSISDVDISVNLAHARISDLRLRLQGPSGTTVTLFDQLGGSGSNINTTAFDDEAESSITIGLPPYGGRFRPQQPLSAFDGQSMTGTWRLIIDDLVADETGTLNSATVSIRTAPNTIDRIEPFQASYDIFITRAGSQSDILLLNDGAGNFSAAPGIPAVQASSYAAVSGNVFLRTITQQIDGVAFQRPLVDIVVGLDRDLEDGNPVVLFLNSATSPGSFSNRSAEIPRVLSTVLGDAVTDDISGNIRALKLVDGDNDGDLDLYVGQNGRFTTTFVGATDWYLKNRTIGDGWLNLTRDPAALQPGVLPSLRATAATPGGGARGQTLTVRVFGSGFRNGMGVDFGDDITVINYGGVTAGWIDVKLHIENDASLGSRPITVLDELGLPYKSDLNLFRVLTTSGSATSASDWDLYE
jgi:subtilisin-like proprotein convertase family protein